MFTLKARKSRYFSFVKVLHPNDEKNFRKMCDRDPKLFIGLVKIPSGKRTILKGVAVFPFRITVDNAIQVIPNSLVERLDKFDIFDEIASNGYFINKNVLDEVKVNLNPLF